MRLRTSEITSFFFALPANFNEMWPASKLYGVRARPTVIMCRGQPRRSYVSGGQGGSPQAHPRTEKNDICKGSRISGQVGELNYC